jgi:hypothetical protein
MSAIPALDNSSIGAQRASARIAPSASTGRQSSRSAVPSTPDATVEFTLSARGSIEALDDYSLRAHPTAPTDDPLGKLPDKPERNAGKAEEKEEEPPPQHVLQVALLSTLKKAGWPYQPHVPSKPTLDVLA